MPAYVIGHVDITDPEGYKEYASQTPACVERHGGRFLARGGRAEKLEGSVDPKRLVLIEFPSYEQAKSWYESEAYRPLIPTRRRTADADMLLVDGWDG